MAAGSPTYKKKLFSSLNILYTINRLFDIVSICGYEVPIQDPSMYKLDCIYHRKCMYNNLSNDCTIILNAFQHA